MRRYVTAEAATPPDPDPQSQVLSPPRLILDDAISRRSERAAFFFAPKRKGRPVARTALHVISRSTDQARAARTLSAMALKPVSSAAMAAMTLRSSSMPALDRPWMNCE